MATYKTLVKLSLTFSPFMDSVLVPNTIPEGTTVNIEQDRGNGWLQLSIVPGDPLGWIFNSCKVLDDDGHLVNSPCIELTRIYNLLIADASAFRSSALAVTDKCDATLLNSYAEFREVFAAEILANRETPENLNLENEMVLIGNLLHFSADPADAELAERVSDYIAEHDARVLAELDSEVVS